MREEEAQLSGRLALIAGASGGLGEACARTLARAGARTVLAARRRERLEALAGEVGGRALPADLDDEEGVAGAVAELRREEGVPDVVLNAAGVFDLAPVAETPVAVLDRNLGVNLRGAFLLVRAVLPGMLERGSGLIVSVGSVAGRRAFPENGAYSASKFGLRGLHAVLREELRGTGVRTTLLEPGAVDTGLWDPLDPDRRPDLPDRRGMLAPEAVAEAALFVATRPDGVCVPVVQIESA